MGIIRDAMDKIGMGGKDAAETNDEKPERVIGKIIKVDKDEKKGGWGFISSKSIPYTRIFFHWTSLKQDTLNFSQLEKGMTVEFTPQHSDDKGYRALQIKVVTDEVPTE